MLMYPPSWFHTTRVLPAADGAPAPRFPLEKPGASVTTTFELDGLPLFGGLQGSLRPSPFGYHGCMEGGVSCTGWRRRTELWDAAFPPPPRRARASLDGPASTSAGRDRARGVAEPGDGDAAGKVEL